MDAVFIDVGLQRPEENDLGEQFMSIVRDSSSVYHFAKAFSIVEIPSSLFIKFLVRKALFNLVVNVLTTILHDNIRGYLLRLDERQRLHYHMT